MEIHNAIIITDDETTLKMTLDEQRNFTGNVVFSRDKLPEIYADILHPDKGPNAQAK